MARPWQLETFSAEPTRDEPVEAEEAVAVLSEEDRLQAFDKGYKDGWEDATAAHAQEQSHLSAEFGNNLQALSFTYHEARTAILAEMEALVNGLITAVLPAAAVGTLGTLIRDRVAELAETQANVPVEIVISPVNRVRLDAVLADRVAPPIVIHEEPSLGEGQAFLRFASREEKLDLDAVLAEIRTAIEGFFAAADAAAMTDGPDHGPADLEEEDRKSA